MKKYKVIYADPPWAFKNKRTGGSLTSGSAHQYATMNTKDLKELDVASISEDNCVLFMWWVASQPEEALGLVEAWGFKVKTMTGFVWEKRTKRGKPHFGMGFWTRAGAECCLIAVKGNARPLSRSVRSVVSSPVGKHSEKPSTIRDRIVELCGDVPRVELFARERTEGWDVFGNEVNGGITIGMKEGKGHA